MRLRVLSDYRNQSVVYTSGQELDVSDSFGRWLLSDAPGCFEEVQPQRKSMDAPPVDKMLRSAPVAKAQADAQDSTDWQEMTVAKLQDVARARGVSYSGLRKAELIEALQEAD